MKLNRSFLAVAMAAAMAAASFSSAAQPDTGSFEQRSAAFAVDERVAFGLDPASAAITGPGSEPQTLAPPVPELQSYALMAIGLVAIGVRMRRRSS